MVEDVEILGCAADDAAGTARGFHRDVEHRMHDGVGRWQRTKPQFYSMMTPCRTRPSARRAVRNQPSGQHRRRGARDENHGPVAPGPRQTAAFSRMPTPKRLLPARSTCCATPLSATASTRHLPARFWRLPRRRAIATWRMKSWIAARRADASMQEAATQRSGARLRHRTDRAHRSRRQQCQLIATIPDQSATTRRSISRRRCRCSPTNCAWRAGAPGRLRRTRLRAGDPRRSRGFLSRSWRTPSTSAGFLDPAEPEAPDAAHAPAVRARHARKRRKSTSFAAS